MATLETQHELIKAVFKGKLVYSDGVFRTPAIAPMFEVNTLVSMKKGCSFMSSPVKFGRQTRRVPGMEKLSNQLLHDLMTFADLPECHLLGNEQRLF